MNRNPMKKAIKKLNERNNFYKIFDRNGCPLFFPKISDEQLQILRADLRVYAIDGLLGREWDVQGEPEIENGFVNFRLKEHDKDREMAFTIPLDQFQKIVMFVYDNNFSSVDKFVNNMLPSFNGPDNACFIGVNYGGEGIQIGFILPLPAQKFEA